jgi:hypothetical protein
VRHSMLQIRWVGKQALLEALQDRSTFLNFLAIDRSNITNGRTICT